MHTNFVRHGLVAAALLFMTGPVLAESLLQIPSPPEAVLVRDMLQQDAQRALATEQDLERARSGGAKESGDVHDSVTLTPASASSLALAGIYGLDGILTAEIEINGSRHVFRLGQTQIVGADHGEAYRLVAIKPPCATVRKPDTSLQRVCHPKFQQEM